MELSVIIPTHNRKEILKKVLMALQNQSYPHDKYEVIVVDDGSTDSTSAVAKDFNIRYFYRQKNCVADARNFGIEKSRGNYILFLNNDTIPEKKLIEEHLKTHNNYPNVAVVGLIKWHNGIKKTDFMRYLTKSNIEFQFKKIKHKYNIGYRFFYSSNISLSRKWLELENFDTNFKYAAFEDIELGYRLEKRGLKIFYNPRALAYHYHFYVPDTFCHKRMENTGKSASYFQKKHKDVGLKIKLMPFDLFPFGISLFNAFSIFLIKTKISKELYWFGRICNSYAKGINEYRRASKL